MSLIGEALGILHSHSWTETVETQRRLQMDQKRITSLCIYTQWLDTMIPAIDT